MRRKPVVLVWAVKKGPRKFFTLTVTRWYIGLNQDLCFLVLVVAGEPAACPQLISKADAPLLGSEEETGFGPFLDGKENAVRIRHVDTFAVVCIGLKQDLLSVLVVPDKPAVFILIVLTQVDL